MATSFVASVEFKTVGETELDQHFLNVKKPILKKKSEEEHSIPLEPYAGIHQVRPIRVSPAKPGKLYPCLSDIESVTENENDSESDEQHQGNTPQSVK